MKDDIDQAVLLQFGCPLAQAEADPVERRRLAVVVDYDFQVLPAADAAHIAHAAVTAKKEARLVLLADRLHPVKLPMQGPIDLIDLQLGVDFKGRAQTVKVVELLRGLRFERLLQRGQMLRAHGKAGRAAMPAMTHQQRTDPVERGDDVKFSDTAGAASA